MADKWGNLVSYTNTIESGYGAGMFAGYYPAGCAEISCFKSFGFLLNNELTDFNFTPSINTFTGQPATNDVAPGKRPRSSMVPTMIFDAKGRPIVAYGSPGGSTIINSVFNVTLNLLDHGMTIQEAIDAPRLSVTAAGGSVSHRHGQPARAHAVPARVTRRSARARAHRERAGRHRLGADDRDRPENRQAVRRRGLPARRHGDRTAAAPPWPLGRPRRK